MQALYVLYDETCGFCCRAAEWLQTQPKYLSLTCLSAGAQSTRDAFPGLRRTAEKTELIVIDEQGGVYREADAWVAVMWSLRGYRSWARKLNNPQLRPLARNVFEFISSNRHRVSEWFGLQPHAYIARSLVERYGAPEVPKCVDDGCEVTPAVAAGPSCPNCKEAIPPAREYCPSCLARLFRETPAPV